MNPYLRQVVDNLEGQSLGPTGTTVRDLDLPDEFVRRVAGRVLLDSFERDFRAVVARPGAIPPPPPPEAEPLTRAVLAGVPAWVTVLGDQDETGGANGPGVAIGAGSWPAPEAVPANRAHRAPLLGGAAPWPDDLPAAGDDPALARAAREVAVSLAPRGLLVATGRAIAILGAARLASAARGAPNGALALLARVGVPVDLLGFLAPPQPAPGRAGEAAADAAATVRWLAERFAAGGAAFVESAAREARFGFRPTLPGFRAASDAGDEAAGLARLQLPRGDFFTGPGIGGGLDLLGAVLASAGCAGYVSVQREHVAALLRALRRWAAPPARLLVSPAELPVSQWAQDNSKPGRVGARSAVLLPRYASRGEECSRLVPGDTAVLACLARDLGDRAVFAQSPLLFQGGNAVIAPDPARGRVLLLGEAEVWRNRALGLSAAQATEALRLEFGADRCTVLPAASYHADYEISVRAGVHGVTAFVNDTPAAVRLALGCGVATLAQAGLCAGPAARRARRGLVQADSRPAAEVAASVLARFACPGGVTFELAQALGERGDGTVVADLGLLMWAVDTARALAGAGGDAATEAADEVRRDRELDRARLGTELSELGWEVIPVPSTSAGRLSACAVNAVHLPETVLVPGRGGMFSELDAQAAAAIGTRIAPASVRVLAARESLGRGGGVHCSASIWPRGNPEGEFRATPAEAGRTTG
ncbi:MAG TPA: hypothetical protein VD963_10630 [Phycisphaerales bacterium]|nr:hypothetical protein [Phycisphaerales bacterium]